MKSIMKKPDFRWSIISNWIEFKQFSGQLNEISTNEIEEQKGESILIERKINEVENYWIQTKEETEGMTLSKVTEAIVKATWGDNYSFVQEENIQNKLNSLELSSFHIENEHQNKREIDEATIHTLMNRPKGSHLTYRQKLLIYKSFRYDENPINQICQKYDVSISTVKKIIREFNANVKREEIYSKIRSKKMIWLMEVEEWISGFIWSKIGGFTSLDIQKHIMKKLSILIPRNQIWKHLKFIRNLSYKKGNARPFTIDANKIQLQKQLFWTKLAQHLYKLKILINLDESTTSGDTKINYSWLQTGKHWTINNIVFRGSVNFVSWIATNGWAVNLVKYCATNANILIKFLMYVLKQLKDQGVNPNETGIIMDNCAFHRAKWVKDYWRSVGVNLYYLPAYWPELAPIELYFSRMKASFVENLGEQQINLKSDAAISAIAGCLNLLSKDYIKSLWRNFFLLSGTE